MVAAVVALAVVAAFILALHSAPSTGLSAVKKPTATTQVTATAGVTRGKWASLPGLTHLDAMPVIAPSDPRIVYVASPRLRRSADGGATWKDLPLPSSIPADASYAWLDLFVSPTNADTIFATASVNVNGACVTALAAPSHIGALAQLKGSPACSSQYVSADGGQTWKALAIGGDSTLRLGNLNAMHTGSNPYSSTPEAQQGSLYSLAGYGPQATGPGFRIVRSTDGGVTWQTIDGGLTARGLNVCDYAASDTPSRVYALASPQMCNVESTPPLQLWATDDNGGRWDQVSLPRQGLDMGMVASGGALYIALAQPSGQSHVCCGTLGPTDYLVYDGGQIWVPSPAQGQGLLSQSVALAALPIVTAGRTPGILATFVNPTADQVAPVLLFTWAAGQRAWQPAGFISTNSVVSLLVTTDSSSGLSTYWLVTSDGPAGAAQYSVQRYTP